jgi:hypothetical protein
MFRRLFLAGLAVAATGTVTVAQAGGKWVLISTREVDYGRDVDTIDLARAKGTFTALRFNVKRGAIRVSNIDINYGTGDVSGGTHDIVVGPGERSRPIEINGEDRAIESITVAYNSNPALKHKAQVEIFALKGRGYARHAHAGPATGQVATTPTGAIPAKVPPGGRLPGGEVLFGAQAVGFGIDRDVIRVGAEIGKFDRVRFRVLENDIFINEMKVIYSDGEPDVLAVDAEVKQNTKTRWFDLGGDRFIREIQFTYRSRPNFRGQARIEVYGDYADNWLGPHGEGRRYNQGWVLLGAQPAGFVGFDNDLIPVGRNEGGFRKIRVAVKDRDITLNELRVIYGNGKEDVLPIKSKVEAGSSYGPLDLQGGTRTIKEIRAKYRSRFFDKDAIGKGAAIVEVWGQH